MVDFEIWDKCSWDLRIWDAWDEWRVFISLIFEFGKDLGEFGLRLVEGNRRNAILGFLGCN